MDTFFKTIRDFFNVIITPGIYPDYIEDEERNGQVYKHVVKPRKRRND